jgi:hypothetical protein
MEPVLLGHRAGDVGTSGYVASSTLPHPRLHAVALYEGLCLLIGFDRRPDPFRHMIVSVRGCPRSQPAERGPIYQMSVNWLSARASGRQQLAMGVSPW